MEFKLFQILPLAIGGAFAFGLGLGAGLTSLDKIFVLEVNYTPLSSFVLKGTFKSLETVPIPILEAEKGQYRLDDIA